jgi:hypothetical protein
MSENIENNEKAKPKNILLGTISYDNEEDYDNFLDKMDVNQAIFVLIASAKYCQSKGVFNLGESELMARSIKTIQRSSQKEKTTNKKGE